MRYTVGELIRASARLRWFCELGHAGDVDLLAIQERAGPDLDLTNRRPPCREPGCPGRVEFKDLSRVFPRSLDTVPQMGKEWWDYNDARRDALKAAGCRVEGGKWRGPAA